MGRERGKVPFYCWVGWKSVSPVVSTDTASRGQGSLMPGGHESPSSLLAPLTWSWWEGCGTLLQPHEGDSLGSCLAFADVGGASVWLRYPSYCLRVFCHASLPFGFCQFCFCLFACVCWCFWVAGFFKLQIWEFES